MPPNNDVSVYSFASSTNVWWKAIESKLTRIQNLTVWISDGTRSIEVAPVRLCGNEQFGQFSDVIPVTVSGS